MKLKLYFDKYLLKINSIFISLLLIFGFFLVSSATAVESQRIYDDSFYMIKNHSVAVFIGLIMFMIIRNLNTSYISYFSRTLIVLISVVLFILITYGENLNGSTRWLDIGIAVIQPSEFAKPIILLWVASQLSNNEINESDIKTVWRTIFMPGLAAALMLFQPDFGMAATIAFIVFIQLLFSKIKVIYPLLISILGSFLGWFLLVQAEYRDNRLKIWIERTCDQGEELLNKCYQIHQSRIAISSGGMTGLGPGTSRARWGSLPHAYSDFISSIIGEEYGFIGYLVFIFILSLCILSFFLIAVRTKDQFKKVFIAGLGAWILFQSILNLGASVYLLPVTGIVLPFVSYGGSAMVSIFIALGIMYSNANE